MNKNDRPRVFPEAATDRAFPIRNQIYAFLHPFASVRCHKDLIP